MPINRAPLVTTYACTISFIIICFGITFSLTVHSTIDAWGEYRKSLSLEDWPMKECYVEEFGNNTCSRAEDDLIILFVTLCVDSDSGCSRERERTASFPTNRSCSPRNTIENFVKDNNVTEDATIKCWVSDSNRYVRMDKGGYEAIHRGNLKFRAVITTLTATVLALVVAYFLHKFFQSFRLQPSQRTYDFIRPPSASAGANSRNLFSSRSLTTTEATAFINAYRTDRPLSDGVCPICLDDFAAEPKPTVRLSCNHCYHADCTRQWLQKKEGNPSCPYCGQDLSKDVARLLPRSDRSVDGTQQRYTRAPPSQVRTRDPRSITLMISTPRRGHRPDTPSSNASPATSPNARLRTLGRVLDRPFFTRHRSPHR